MPIVVERVLLAMFVASTAPALSGQASTPADRAAAWERHQTLERESPFRDLPWRAIGPMQAGARIEAIDVAPGSPETLYVGVGSGNLWRSQNGGLHWTPIFEQQSSAAIGEVAVAPSDPRVVWVGTGETQPRHSGYSYAGTGVFRSTDGGDHWEHLGLADTHHIAKIVVHPRDPDTAWVAALGHFWTPNAERGVFKTVDGGRSWQAILQVSEHCGACDLVVDPRDPERLFAAMWQQTGPGSRPEWRAGPQSAIYRSLDGGRSWTRSSQGLPAGPLGRSGLALAPSNPSIVYAVLDDHGPSEHEKREIVGAALYRSDDGGDHWRRTAREDLYELFTLYGWKFCDVRVAPDDPERVFLLGNRGWVSNDGGRSFTRIGETVLRVHDTRGVGMHLDQHELWIDPADPRRLLLGNDGGLYESRDGGKSWLHLNTIPAAEFYAISVDGSTPYRVFGGTQDNAALYGPSDATLGEGPLDPWENVYLDPWTGGDSFDTLVDPTDPRFVYYEHQHGALRRMDLEGESVQSWGKSAVGLGPRPPQAEERWRFGWHMPFLISSADPSTLIAGGDHVIESNDRGASWRAVSPMLGDPAQGSWAPAPYGTITSIAQCPHDRGRLVVGTEAGRLWRRDGAAKDFEALDAGLPDKWVTRVIASAHQEGRILVSLSGYREDDFRAYLYRRDAGGTAWESLVDGLPDETIQVVREDPGCAGLLYVGTSRGVYARFETDGRWVALSATLPTTPVHDLVVHPAAGELVAGTHGRSVWICDLAPVRQMAESRRER